MCELGEHHASSDMPPGTTCNEHEIRSLSRFCNATCRSLATRVWRPLGSETALACRLLNVRMNCTEGCSTAPSDLQQFQEEAPHKAA